MMPGVQRAGRELTAAGIRAPDLVAAYEHCRRLNARHGRTYFLATRLLPMHKRPYVHALYGFARHADELVDNATDTGAFQSWVAQARQDLSTGESAHPVTRAVLHTAETWAIPHSTFEAFLDSMEMDLTLSGYATYVDLERYMHGSAAVIGLQMLPLLEPLDRDAAVLPARRLGEAFQLTNFLRDVAEDLCRGRVYLPEEDLDRFGVRRIDLAPGPVPAHVRDLLAFEIARARGLYAEAAPGIELVAPSSRDCLRTAFRLYSGILDAIEAADYQVLDRRVAVPLHRRAAVAVPALVSSRRARRSPAVA
jgi:phytoene synthase